MGRKITINKVDLGQNRLFTLGHAMNQYDTWRKHPETENPSGLRTVMGFALPTWQRGLVWTEAQSISFIESVWRGLPLGTYSYNRASYKSPNDNLLIDGQQRLYAVERYISDHFPVFGLLWSELDKIDHRYFDMTPFGAFVTTTEDEAYLRSYYDLMNFSGTAHRDDERTNPTGGAL